MHECVLKYWLSFSYQLLFYLTFAVLLFVVRFESYTLSALSPEAMHLVAIIPGLHAYI